MLLEYTGMLHKNNNFRIIIAHVVDYTDMVLNVLVVAIGLQGVGVAYRAWAWTTGRGRGLLWFQTNSFDDMQSLAGV